MPTLVCPTCGRHREYDKADDVPFRPFCSPRCQMIDLGNWLDGRYSIPGSTDATTVTDTSPSPGPDSRENPSN